jgi:hypothetical protein
MQSGRDGPSTIRRRGGAFVCTSWRDNGLHDTTRRHLGPTTPLRKTRLTGSGHNPHLRPRRLQHVQARLVDGFERKLGLKPLFRGGIQDRGRLEGAISLQIGPIALEAQEPAAGNIRAGPPRV